MKGMTNAPKYIQNPLHEYQKQAQNFIINNKKCGLFLDMGLGKTRITLDTLVKLNPTSHVLIIAPKNVTKSTWIDEINKWEYPLRTKSLIIDKKGKPLSKKKRLELYEKAIDEKTNLYFINRELITDLIDNMPIRNNKKIWCFPNVVIDELHSFKNYKSKRFIALKKVTQHIDRFIGLTGTPTPAGLMDLW